MTRNSEAILVLCGFLAVAAVLISVLAPLIRAELLRTVVPVGALDFEEFTCDGTDMTARGWLVKNDVGAGQGAIITQFTVLDDGPGAPPGGDSIIISQSFNGPDLVSRPAGFGYLSLDLPRMCNRRFMIKTLHQHPDDPAVIIQSCFGPFGYGVTLPNPRLC